ncbi:hypothetical protein L484_012634 [Morus notabilis]|uniref:Uncharacterized protein n=1 Tax=Morus notabilis TaxID=981085 RepID=W9SK17_9ROSA|nr:transcription termination factor MTEF18, mitochondrial [Morus notabilis]EXC32467.1 hypothetical protein L484_012634 [Morus notabilis]
MTLPIKASHFSLFLTFLSRNFSSSKARTLPIIKGNNYISSTQYKTRALKQAQNVLTEYLHATRGLPFIFAEQISANSLFAISELIRKIHFSAFTFSDAFKRFLRYHPINEFEFFLESIGIHRDDVHLFLPKKKFFFSEDSTVLDASLALIQFGFPWNKLGLLYREEVSIFSMSGNVLTDRLNGFKERFGFDNLCVVGVCLAFPYLLSVEGKSGGCIEAVFEDLETVFRGFEMGSCVEGNVDAWYELCCKVRVLYDLGFEKGKVGELLCDRKQIFLECPKEVLVRKVDYFAKFGVGKDDVLLFLLENREILNLDFETRVISVLGLLKHFGIGTKELQSVSEKYPHVLGRNKMENFPYVMKALDLHEWCFDKIRSSNGQILAMYSIDCPDEDMNKEFSDGLKKIESSKCPTHAMNKLDFLKQIGFGENALTLKVLNILAGSRSELQSRFDFLLSKGFEHANLCLMIRTKPKILNQGHEKLEPKLNFWCQEIGSSIQELERVPGFLCFDLENRTKRRYRFYVWLRKTGVYTKKCAISSMIYPGEKQFIKRLLEIHPAAPKWYLECF